MTKQVVKAPASVLDIGVVWTKWLDNGDRIVSSSWISSNPELILQNSTNDNTSTRVFISGGVLGKLYTVTNRITTNSGLTDERYIVVFVQTQGAT